MLLPVTVVSVDHAGGELYRVVLAMADGTTQNYLIPASMATIEGVSISAAALAQILDPDRPYSSSHNPNHTRYAPRT